MKVRGVMERVLMGRAECLAYHSWGWPGMIVGMVTDKTMKMGKAALMFWKSGRVLTALGPRRCPGWGMMWMRVRLVKPSPLLTNWTISIECYTAYSCLLVCVSSPTLEVDIGSCAKESSRQDVTITLTIVKIRSGITVRILVFILDIFRFYVFWMGWFQITIVEVKIITLEISFGSSPSPSPSPVIFPPDLLLNHDKPLCF